MVRDDESWLRKRVGLLLALLTLVNHRALADDASSHALLLGVAPRAHRHGQISRVGDQALLARPDRLEVAFAGERLLFEHAEAAAVERQATGVVEP